MAAAVGQGVHGDLPMAPRYQLYKSLAMKIYGTNGNVDDSAAPFDHSMTRDLSIRPHLPFCVDISLCTSEETAQRMRRYFQVTHETGNFYQQQGGESGESTPPLPPGWIDVGGGGDETTTAEEGGGSAADGGKSKKTINKKQMFLEWNEQIIQHKSSGGHKRAAEAYKSHMSHTLLATLDEIKYESKKKKKIVDHDMNAKAEPEDL